jgi:hypothetical protein
MTKRRAPCTFENALTTVAGALGWEEVARILGVAERTARNWSEPDTTANIRLGASLKLDSAFLAAGGEGAPFLQCYETQLELETMAACPGREALIHGAGVVARESGQAVAATLTAAHPAATATDIMIAEREHEEAITAHTNALAALRARRTSNSRDEGTVEVQGQGGAPAMTA